MNTCPLCSQPFHFRADLVVHAGTHSAHDWLERVEQEQAKTEMARRARVLLDGGKS